MAVKTTKAKTKTVGQGVKGKAKDPTDRLKPPKPVRGSKTPKILALAQTRPELTNSDIAEIVGVTDSNITQTLQRYGIDRPRVDDFINNKVKILSGIQEKFITELKGRSLEKESVHTLVVDAGIIQDKIRDIIHGKSGNSGVNVNINIGDPTKTIDVTDT